MASLEEDTVFIYINHFRDVKELSILINSLTEDEFIGLDTEFFRRNFLLPKFSLLQLAIRGTNYVVDVWSLDQDVQPLIESLSLTKAAILLFACHEDLELLSYEIRHLYKGLGLPKKVYDLQLMLSFFGHSFGRGLSSVLEEFLGIHLDKKCTRSDWMQRPLYNEQLKYAALDVQYLEPLFWKIREHMDDKLFSYFQDEMAYICQEFNDPLDEDDLYLAVPSASTLNMFELNILQYLAKNRYLQAEKEDHALTSIMPHNAMWQIAKAKPRSKLTLFKLGLKDYQVHRYGDLILMWVRKACKEPLYSNLTIPFDYFAHRRDMVTNLNLLRDTVQERLADAKFCHNLLAKKPLFNDYFRAKYFGKVPLLQQGWRKEVLGTIDIQLDPLPSEVTNEETGEKMIVNLPPLPRNVKDLVERYCE